MALWPRAIVRPMRFHDLRHTTATLLLRAGVAAPLVHRILRHRDLRTTLGTYAHLDADHMRAALTKLPAAKVLPFSTRLLLGADSRSSEARTPANSPVDPGLKLERNTGFEPATFALARRRSTN